MDELVDALGTDLAGLSSEEAARRLAREGANTIEPARGHRGMRLLVAQFESPIMAILAAATLVAMALGDTTDGGIIGLRVDNALTGSMIDDLDDSELTARVGDVAVYSEVDPLLKERIVRALRSGGETVGFLGDGINDAAALHAADVGISVDTAVDVAKQTAAIVLLDKSLDVVAEGVRLGRRTLANTLKYVRVTTTVDPEQLEAPKAWNIKSIRRFMIVFGLVSSAFDMLSFLVLRVLFDAGPGLFRSGWFIESTATELAVMLVLRTARPFWQSRPGRGLLTTSIVIAAVTIALPYSPLAEPPGLVVVPIRILAALAGLTARYGAVNEVVKRRVLIAPADAATPQPGKPPLITRGPFLGRTTLAVVSNPRYQDTCYWNGMKDLMKTLQPKHVTSAAIDSLVHHIDSPSVSLILPLDRRHPDDRGAHLQLKRLIAVARAQLQSASTPDVDALLEPAEALLRRKVIAEHSGGLALFLSPGLAAELYLDTPVEPLACTGDRFTVGPLLASIDSGRTCYVLTVGAENIALFRARRSGWIECDVPDLPRSEKDALWYERDERMSSSHAGGPTGASGMSIISHGSGAQDEDRKEQLQRFFLKVDHAVVHFLLEDPEAALVVAGTAPSVARYKQI
ncbi:MAG: HAD-IC family P-type ATPase, partial [Ilumatobacteraceae bacterium]